MKNKATEEETFLHRYAPVVAILALLTLITAAVLGTIFVLRNNAASPTAPTIAIADLPGPKYQISKRSEEQVGTLLKENPHIVGAFVTRYKYAQGESQFIYSWGRSAAEKKKLDQALRALTDADNGMSSEEKQAMAYKDSAETARLLRNSQEAKQGLIKCISISEAAVRTQIKFQAIGTGICYATIPPFEEKASLGIYILTDSPLNEFNEIAEARRVLLMLQIDIYNRDYQGRETWAHP